MLVMSPAPQQSPIRCLQTFDQHKLKPLHTTETEKTSLPYMFDQRMFTSFLQQTALLVTNHRDNEQTRQTTRQQDYPPRTTASSIPRSENRLTMRQLIQHGFDDCPTQPLASRLTNRSHAARLQRHPPAFDVCRCSNLAIHTHLRSTLQITRVNSNSHSHARRHFMQCISNNHRKYPDS